MRVVDKALGLLELLAPFARIAGFFHRFVIATSALWRYAEPAGSLRAQWVGFSLPVSLCTLLISELP
jgi:hypothetical protein